MLHSWHFFFHLQACLFRCSTCGWHFAFTSRFSHVTLSLLGVSVFRFFRAVPGVMAGFHPDGIQLGASDRFRESS